MNVYPDGQAPSLLLLEKVARRPDVEGTPCGIAVLKKTFKAVNSMFWLHFLTNSGARYRCPLHIPPLRRGPSPAGEGFWGLCPRVYDFARAFLFRWSVPPLISLGCAEPASPKGKLLAKNATVYSQFSILLYNSPIMIENGRNRP